jgi:signal peptidase I
MLRKEDWLPGETDAVAAQKDREWFYDMVDTMIVALVLVTVVCSCLFRLVGVSGQSMAYTLKNGDKLLMFHAFYNEPDYGDIVVIARDDGEPLIKRVIAKAGDTVEIKESDMKVYLNGEKLEEPYLSFDTPPLYGFTGPYTVPENCVFVLGDNRPESHDSRDLETIGAVHVDDILGKAFFRVAPLSSFGMIE